MSIFLNGNSSRVRGPVIHAKEGPVLQRPRSAAQKELHSNIILFGKRRRYTAITRVSAAFYEDRVQGSFAPATAGKAELACD